VLAPKLTPRLACGVARGAGEAGDVEQWVPPSGEMRQ
jgi:hypothetical protein